MNKSELPVQIKGSQAKSIEKQNLKNTSMNIKPKPSLNIKNHDRSTVKTKESKSRHKDTATKKSSKSGRNDKRMANSANRYTAEATATRRGKTFGWTKSISLYRQTF